MPGNSVADTSSFQIGFSAVGAGFACSVTEVEFDPATTLLPGFTPPRKEEPKNEAPSVTEQAKPAPTAEKPIWKDDVSATLLPGITPIQSAPAQPAEIFDTPELTIDQVAKNGDKAKSDPNAGVKHQEVSLDDLDSLFV